MDVDRLRQSQTTADSQRQESAPTGQREHAFVDKHCAQVSTALPEYSSIQSNAVQCSPMGEFGASKMSAVCPFCSHSQTVAVCQLSNWRHWPVETRNQISRSNGTRPVCHFCSFWASSLLPVCMQFASSLGPSRARKSSRKSAPKERPPHPVSRCGNGAQLTRHERPPLTTRSSQTGHLELGNAARNADQWRTCTTRKQRRH